MRKMWIFFTLAICADQFALAETKKTSPDSSSLQKNHKNKTEIGSSAQILDWVAFGSGCRSSKSNPQKEVGVLNSIATTVISKIRINSLVLDLSQKQKGLSECAIRLSVQPPAGMRISQILAQSTLLASKDSNTHLRARLLLLVGESLVAKREWDLKKNDFARHREENIILLSGSSSEYEMPKVGCEKPQIIGVDYTFEGVREKEIQTPLKNQDEITLRTKPIGAGGESARIEVSFEKCKPEAE